MSDHVQNNSENDKETSDGDSPKVSLKPYADDGLSAALNWQI